MSLPTRTWHKNLPAWTRRSQNVAATKKVTSADFTISLIAPKPEAPRESWWTRPVQSREEFDQLAAERSRAAGWTGVNASERSR